MDESSNSSIDHTMNARRDTRTNEKSLTAMAQPFLPMLQLQSLALHLWANNLSIMARNVERASETLTTMVNDNQPKPSQ